ncbi:hypothetical protein AMATHDRAFT_44276 [Amanita thiersii Skay4041]|uniref:EKC/KEOPS complex subunit CGI121 n=1 Tax=Amanita thiersii Skay4041 TaxID=703135 RepID=A0A2A9NB85_9AGAR|nr:hypothetical protein AMATHDRAFT_44276 [Amanita thiersii Skay4041]
MQSIHFPSYPPSFSIAHVALYTSLAPGSAASLRQRIITASTLPQDEAGNAEREAVNFAFINPHLITSRLHLQTAISQAIIAETGGSLRTKTVHSEILWVLNPTNNISEAIRRYGVSDISTALLVVRVCGPDLSASQAQEQLDKIVQGTLVPFALLDSLTDWDTIKKYHKLNNEPAILAAKGDIECERRVVDNIVTSTVAMKSVAS